MSQAQARIPAQVHRPALVADETQAFDAALDGKRRRPVLAMNGKQMVVCCSRTARKHGWEIVGRMFQR